ncbi:MAG TPA: carboxypeptidase-like regulatory domain-containing protein [Pyrinomonadaceae bacterium]|nr:carboxypeptidase-like regulatory domain-containing protein [Pyrinomonadaceae bacterium]
MNKTLLNKSAFVRSTASVFAASCLVFVLFFGFALPLPFGYESRTLPSRFSLVTPVSAGNTYYNFSSGNLSLTLTADPASADLIAVNNDWSSIPHVEGYRGDDLAPEGTDPQTVTSTETGMDFPLPLTPSTYIQANKGNTSAVNNGGLAEFDRAPDVNNICYGFQGNVQADNPYMVFYINTTGRFGINMSYRVRDVDAGNNSSVSAIALQYRLGESGPFINVPAGFIADATDGPNISGRVTTRNVALPAAVNNQPQVQVRLITSNAAGPDEWIGVNNIVLGPFGPTAAGASVGGRIYSPHGRPLANARVLMYDGSGSTRAAISNAFGYYRFEGVPVGQTYIFEVRSRRYAFSEAIRTLSVQEDFDSLDFYADSASLLDMTPAVLDGKR